jgi:hypothetical protein
MSNVPVINTTTVVAKDGVTVVSQPRTIKVIPIEQNVSVVSLTTSQTVVSAPKVQTLVSVPNTVSVVADQGYVGPRVYFSATPPLGAKLNDLWVRT